MWYVGLRNACTPTALERSGEPAMSRLPSRPCLALPFTVLPGPDRVRLIAGEDFRYTLAAPGLETWLPDVLSQLDGRRTLDELLAALPADRHDAARQLLARLYG